MKKNHILVAIIFVIFCITPLIPISDSSDSVTKPSSDTIKVMNFNLHFGVEIDKGYSLDGFRDVILDNEPNIVGFQEVTINSPINGFAPMFSDLLQMMENIGFPYYYFTEGGATYLRNAVFSQFKILEKHTEVFDTQ
ncbi:MAG: hypothetical protein ACXAD7_19905, partial [Candidatus Kariarchaeaceae archaeon]